MQERDTEIGIGSSTTTGDRERGLGGSEAGIGSSPEGGRVDEIKTKARDRADDLGHRAMDTLEERAERQKGRATHQLEDLARSLRVASQQMPSDAGISRYMGLAASQVDNLASFLGNNEVADLVDDIEDFARRQPAAFIGGAFAAGMLGARFLKSSRRDLIDEGVSDRWDTDRMTSRVRDVETDAIARPGAPGYAAPAERGDGAVREPRTP